MSIYKCNLFCGFSPIVWTWCILLSIASKLFTHGGSKVGKIRFIKNPKRQIYRISVKIMEQFLRKVFPKAAERITFFLIVSRCHGMCDKYNPFQTVIRRSLEPRKTKIHSIIFKSKLF